MKSRERLLKQTKALPLLGAIQIQFSNISLYLSLYSFFTLSLVLWSTTIVYIAWWPRWITLPTFFVLAILGAMVVMFLDYKFVYPSRVAFLNEQSCKHPNPAMESLLRVEAVQKEQAAEIKAIRKKLGIKRVRKNA